MMTMPRDGEYRTMTMPRDGEYRAMTMQRDENTTQWTTRHYA
jgi:hypothetical protein